MGKLEHLHSFGTNLTSICHFLPNSVWALGWGVNGRCDLSTRDSLVPSYFLFHLDKEAFSKQLDFLNYTVTNNIGDTIKCCKNYSNLHTPVNYKIVYEYGLILLKDSLSEVSGLSYQSILPYFNYPLSIIEDNVKKTKYNKTDINEFYKEQSDKLLEMYGRFLKTCLICKSQVGTREEKMEANEIINSIISQSENLNIGDEIAQYTETNGQVSCAKTLKK